MNVFSRFPLEIKTHLPSGIKHRMKCQKIIYELTCRFLYKDQESQLSAQIFAAKQRELSTH